MAKRKKAMSDSDAERLKQYNAKMLIEPKRPQQFYSELERPRRIPWSIRQIDESLFTTQRKVISQHAVNAEFQFPLVLWGDVGPGKTYLAAHVYMKFPTTAVWFISSEFFRKTADVLEHGELFSEDEAGNSTEYSIQTWWGFLTEAGLVVIDDVGVGEKSTSHNEALWELMERRRHKPLIFTSNRSPDNSDRLSLWEIYDERVMSRIHGGTCIQLSGHDLRAAGGIKDFA